MVRSAGVHVSTRFPEFFVATIRNPNTRRRPMDKGERVPYFIGEHTLS